MRTNNKNMYLKVKGKDIIVSAPKRIKVDIINSFVSEHIVKFVKYIEDSEQAQLMDLDKQFVYVDRKKITYKVLTGFTKRRFLINDQSAYIECKTGSNDEVEKIIKDFLKKRLLEYITKTQPKFEKLMDVPPHSIRATWKTRSWGTNMVNKKSISYSSRLGHYSTMEMNYLMVHELAHHKEPNHSKRFWNIVEGVLPDYKKIQKVLKEDNSLEKES